MQLALQTAQLVYTSTNDQLARWEAYPIAVEAFVAALNALPAAASDAVRALLLALQAITEACACEDAEHFAVVVAAITTMQGMHSATTTAAACSESSHTYIADTNSISLFKRC